MPVSPAASTVAQHIERFNTLGANEATPRMRTAAPGTPNDVRNARLPVVAFAESTAQMKNLYVPRAAVEPAAPVDAVGAEAVVKHCIAAYEARMETATHGNALLPSRLQAFHHLLVKKLLDVAEKSQLPDSAVEALATQMQNAFERHAQRNTDEVSNLHTKVHRALTSHKLDLTNGMEALVATNPAGPDAALTASQWRPLLAKVSNAQEQAVRAIRPDEPMAAHAGALHDYAASYLESVG